MSVNMYLAGVFVTIFVGSLSIIRIVQVKRLDFVVIFLGFTTIFHGVLFIFSLDFKYPRWLLVPSDLSLYAGYAVLYSIIVIIFSVATFLGSSLQFHWILQLRRKAMVSKPLPQNIALRLSICGWLLIALSLLAYWLYSQAYGGFVSLFFKAPLLRAGLLDVESKANPWSILGKMGGLAIVASYIFFGILVAREKQTKYLFHKTNIIGLLLSMFFSLYVIYTWYSRSHLIFYLTAFALGPQVYKNRLRLSKRLLIVTLVLIVILITLLPFVSSHLIRRMRAESLVEYIKLDASIRIIPLFVLLESPEYRWFRDIGYIPIYFLPQRFWRQYIDTASDIITVKVFGIKKEEGAEGAMVIGIVPFAYMQMGMLGVVLLGLVWGIFLKIINWWLLAKLPSGVGDTLYAYVALRLVISSVWGADPQVIIYNHLDIIIGLILLKIITHLRTTYERSVLYV